MDVWNPRVGRRRASILTASALLGAFTLGGGPASAAAPVPFTVAPASLTFSTVVGSYHLQNVTVTAGKKAIVLDSPATFSSTAPFSDTQAGNCWQSYGSKGLKVPAGVSCLIQVAYHPTVAGSSTATMTISSLAASTV